MMFRCCGESHPVGGNIWRVVSIQDRDVTSHEAWVSCPACGCDAPLQVSPDDAWALTLVLRHSEVFRRVRERRLFEEMIARESW